MTFSKNEKKFVKIFWTNIDKDHITWLRYKILLKFSPQNKRKNSTNYAKYSTLFTSDSHQKPKNIQLKTFDYPTIPSSSDKMDNQDSLQQGMSHSQTNLYKTTP